MSPKRIALPSLAAMLLLAAASAQAAAPANMFANPGFEMGQEGWRMGEGKGTVADFRLDDSDAAEGRRSILVTIEKIGDWGTQFGQVLDSGTKGKTYTFAVLARGVGGPVAVQLEIERSAQPYDRVVRTEKVTLSPDKWTELHATFKVEKDYPEGWCAYVSCMQAGARYRADAFRLYEGEYVPYKEAAKEAATVAAARLFDTGAASAEPLSAEAIDGRKGWTEVPEDNVSHAFKGDAVLRNDRLALVVRRKGAGAELYSCGPGGTKRRAVLAPALPGAGAARVASIKITENNAGGAAVDVAFAPGGGKAVTLGFALKMGQPFVETAPRAGAAGLIVEAPCRFAVLPDFFADDIVVDAAEMPVEKADLPCDHFLLHLVPGGEAVVMAVRSVADEDIEAAFAGTGAEKRLQRSSIPYGKDGKVWVALLEAEHVWHTHTVAKDDAGKVVRMDWKTPFPAQWRVDWRRADGLTDSWEMAAQKPGGKFAKFGLFGGEDTLPENRERWTTVLGKFQYPCWTDTGGQGFLQPLKAGLALQGPALVYPIGRARATPLDAYTVVDIVRGTLGVGPCEYVLDVEGQRSEYKGRATCSNRSVLNEIYEKREQKKRRAEVEQSLVDVMIFIRHIRGRIEGYVDFGHRTLASLAAQKKAHPELAEPIAGLEASARAIDERVAARKDKIKTPDDAARLVEEFRAKVLDYEGDDALARCKKFTEAWVDIGGNQDELVGECRWAVRVLRQRAGLAMALDPRLTEIARKIRADSQKVLRNPAGHEAARH